MSDAYHGTRGYTPGNASKDAAEAEAASGKTNELQAAMLRLVQIAQEHGVTVHEADMMSEAHHGQVSSALTKLHIAGRLVALRERRGNAGIYVHPDYVNGRETRPYRRQNQPLTVDEIAAVLVSHSIVRAQLELHRPNIFTCACGRQPVDHDQYVTHVAEALAAALRGES